MRHVFLLVVSFCVLFIVVLQGNHNISAETGSKTVPKEVYGVVEEVNGKASYHYGAGFRKVPLLMRQTWNQGDLIRTGKDTSVRIKMEGTNDVFYVGENTELSYTIQEQNLHITVLKGNVYVSAAKRDTDSGALYVNTSDKMYKVLGTHFIIGVDSYFNDTILNVLSGIVQEGRTRNVEDQGDEENIHIYPGQSSLLNGEASYPIDLEKFLQQLDSFIIESLLRNRHQILEEIDGMANFPPNFVENPPTNEEELSRIKQNLDNLISSIVRRAIEQNQVDQAEITEIINQINSDGRPPFNLDLSYNPELNDAERMLRDSLERQRQLEQQRREEALRRERELQEQKRKIIENATAANQRNTEMAEERERKLQEDLQKRLEERREQMAPERPSPPSSSPRPSRPDPEPDPDPKPDPEPDPEPEIPYLDIALEPNQFSVWAYWEHEGQYHSYRFYVNGVMVEDLFDGYDQGVFVFENLRPDKSHHIKIEAIDEDGNVLARFEEKDAGKRDLLNEITFQSYVYDDVIYFWFEDEENNRYDAWIEDGYLGYPEGGTGQLYVLGIADFEIPNEEFTIHLFANEETEDGLTNYGSATVKLEHDEQDAGLLKLLQVTSDEVYVHWIPPFNENGEGVDAQLYLYKSVGEDDEEEESTLIETHGEIVVIDVSDLERDTTYKIVQKIDDEDSTKEIEFTIN